MSDPGSRSRSSPLRRLAAGLAVLLGVASLAACDSGGGSDPSDPPAAAKPSEAATAPPASRSGAAPTEGGASEPLSIVLITLDTLRSDALGAYGQSLPSSPEIDRLAAEGTLFEHCVTSSPSTLPSHASILTGLQPYAHGARSNPGYAVAAEHVTIAEVLREQGYATGAEVATDVIARHTQLDQGFDVYRDPGSPGAKRNSMRVPEAGTVREVELSERNAEDITRHGLAFLGEHRDEPFFLWLHYYDPHLEWIAPARFQALIPSSAYHAEIRYADYHVGRVRAEIERLGLRERVLVVVTSDHGEGMGEHGEKTHSYFVYDSTMTVPLVVWGPGRVPQGRRVTSLVRSIDVVPTVLDFVGVPAPEAAQGVSLRPLIQASGSDPGLTGYGESIDLHAAFGSAVLRFVRTGDWKYIHKVNPELYHLESDPGETNNRFDTEPERATALQAELRRLLERAPEPLGVAALDVDAETLDRLAALGYAATGATPDPDALASLDLVGPDPQSLIGDIESLSQGWTAVRAERFSEAARIFSELQVSHPDSVRVIDGLVNALMKDGRNAEALPVLRRALEVAPQELRYYGAFAAAALSQGEIAEAERVLLAATEVDACASESRLLLAAVRGAQSRTDEQVEVLLRGLDACSEPSPLWNDAAYALATVENPAHRDPKRALSLAKRAAARSQGDPGVLDTLAVAQAATGDFTGARTTLQKALQLLSAQGASPEATAPYRAHLAAFEAERPVGQGE